MEVDALELFGDTVLSNLDAPPSLTVDAAPAAQSDSAETKGHGRTARLSGHWTALALASDRDHAGALLRRAREQPLAFWDLTAIDRLDHAGGQLLWRTWGRCLPDGVTLTDTQRDIFDRIALLDAQPHASPDVEPRVDPITRLGMAIFGFGAHLRSGITLFGAFVGDLGNVIAHPSRMPWRALSAQIFVMGAQALGITALVAFLIGIVLGYLSAQQLAAFGANAYIVNILGLSIIRELGPVLAAILVAGRSGSAITAQLGVMRLTEELDAMRVMGISHGNRLVLPRVLALAIAMPLLIMWTDAIALMGGMVAARMALGIDFALFLQNLQRAVPIVNFWIGMGKGVVFGTLIALTACHFGFRIKANSQSLGAGTTSSVVSAITVVIFADAVFAIAFQGVGL